MTRFLRAAGAAVLLAGILAGLPAALAAWGRWPISGVPTLEQIKNLPSTVVTDTAVFGALTLAAWVVWAAFAVSVVVELAAQLRGRRSVDVKALGPIQRTARALVTSIVMSIGTAGSMAGPHAAVALATPAVVVAAHPIAPASSAEPSPAAERQPDEGVVIVVEEGDTPWALAEAHLGRGERWREIWTVNQGRSQPDGRAWIDPELILPGWHLVLPNVVESSSSSSSQTSPYQVQAGDTLSGIAEAQLGEAAAVDEIVALNLGVPQADGKALSDPDLIRPGWVLQLPGPGSDVATPPTSGSDVAQPPAPVTPQATVPETSTPSTTTQPVPTTHGDDDTRRGSPSGGDSTDDERESLVGLAVRGISLVGVLYLLDRLRRAQQRHRQPGQRIAAPPPDLQTTEALLRTGADLNGARLVDAALRGAAAGTGAAGLPAVRWVEATTDSVLVVLAEPASPPKGFTDDGPNGWRNVADADELVRLGEHVSSPLPALCPAARTPTGSDVLVDLEHPGTMTISGDPERVTAALRSIAVAMATLPWNVQARVLWVGRSPEIAELDAIEIMGSLTGAIGVAEDHAQRTARTLRSTGCRSIAQARATGATPDAWNTLVIVSADKPHDLDCRRLAALTSRQDTAVAVICPPAAELDAGRNCVIDSEGRMHIDGIDGPLLARGLTETETNAAVAVLDSARTKTSVPVDQADEPVVRQPASTLAPSGGLQELLGEVDIVVRVLGKIDALRRDPASSMEAGWPGDWTKSLNFERHKALEVLCYLALRETNVDREDLEAALYPDGAHAERTYHNAVADARRVIGEDLFPHPEDRHYTLSERVVTDYGLFCELVSRAVDADTDENAIKLLRAALSLVEGEPFVGAGRGFAWVGPHRGMIVAQVIDVADNLAERYLAEGDWREAEWVARRGLRVFPADERMYRILMRAAHAAGNIPGVQRAYRELLDALADPDDGVEPEDTVHPETIELLDKLTGRSSA